MGLDIVSTTLLTSTEDLKSLEATLTYLFTLVQVYSSLQFATVLVGVVAEKVLVGQLPRVPQHEPPLAPSLQQTTHSLLVKRK